MNICFFSREYPPETHFGGIATYTYSMASALAELGHTVHVIAATRGTEFTIHDKGVWIHRIKRHTNIPKELNDFVYSYSVARKAYKIDCQFDIIQCSEFGSEGFWFAMRKKVPLVTRLATPYYYTRRLNGQSDFLHLPFCYWMEKKQTLKSNGIFTSTRALAKEVANTWGIDLSRIAIIPNSVNLSRIRDIALSRPRPDVLKGKKFLLYFGRLEERKGIRVLAEALPRVLHQFPDLHMVFIGADSGYRGRLCREHILNNCFQYGDRLLFFDNLPQEDLFPIVNAATMVVLPSLWEAFGFVSVEAMALGRPVIATSGSGYEEIIEDNVSGYLVKPGNSELLAAKIIWCLKDEGNLNGISEAARKRSQDFEVSKGALKLLAYFEEIVELYLEEKGN